MRPYTRVSLIEASAHDPGGAYIAARRNELDDRHPYVYKTHDYGKTWTEITGGIPETDFARAIREDPVRRGLLYLGTEHGIYFSFDDGGHWQSLQLNLPDTQVADIEVEKHDLAIATHGRSFYVLDDIDLLRQFTPQIETRNFYLFAPEPPVRPLRNAVIDYYLASPAKVALEIVDARGQVVRSFVSDAASNRTAPAPANRVGSNRFEWDLRYPGATTFPGLVLRYAVPGQGPLAPPGEYAVRMTVNGATQTQPLVIQRDPQLAGITDADLQEQFKLAMEIRDELSRAHETVIRIRSMRERMEKSVAEASDAGIAQDAARIKSKLDEIEADLYQVKNRSPRDTLNYPIKLNNQLAVLQRLVDTGDDRPTDQDYAVFRELTGHLNRILERLDGLLATDLKEFNDRLTARKLQPVAVN